MVYEEPISGRGQCSPECGVSQMPDWGRESAKRGLSHPNHMVPAFHVMVSGRDLLEL